MVDDADPRGDFSTDAEVAAAAVTTGLTCSAGRTDRSGEVAAGIFGEDSHSFRRAEGCVVLLHSAEAAAAAVTTGLTCSAGRTDRSANRPLPLFLTVEVMDSGVRGLG